VFVSSRYALKPMIQQLVTFERRPVMKSRVLLFPVLALIFLLGFVIVQLGENKHDTRRSRSKKSNSVSLVEERLYLPEEQEIPA